MGPPLLGQATGARLSRKWFRQDYRVECTLFAYIVLDRSGRKDDRPGPADRGARPAQALPRGGGARPLRPRGALRHRARPARAERRRQDHGGPGADHLLDADDGEARVAGVDVAGDPQEVRRRIGLAGSTPRSTRSSPAARTSSCSVGCSTSAARRARVGPSELLERFDLADAADKGVKQYSGGMRRWLDLAASMILAPAGAVPRRADHGLDPRGRNEVWDAIRALVDRRHHRPARPRSTSRRPTSSRTRSPSSTAAARWPTGTPCGAEARRRRRPDRGGGRSGGGTSTAVVEAFAGVASDDAGGGHRLRTVTAPVD